MQKSFYYTGLKMATLLTGGSVLLASSAFAHHPLGGDAPANFFEGLLSGLGHPMLGLDHLAFIIGVGIVALFCARRIAMPAFFIAGTFMGAALFLSGIVLPAFEVGVTLSVVMLGAVLMSARKFSPVTYAALFAASGLFHGAAYAGTIIGVEATPLAAYFLGLGLVQYAIALSAMVAVGAVTHNNMKGREKSLSANAMQPRLIGASIFGIGVAYMFEIVEGALFVPAVL